MCIDPDNHTEQGLDLEADAPLDELDDAEQERIFSAQFNDVSARDVDGRYVKVQIDGKATQARKIQKTNTCANQMTEIFSSIPKSPTLDTTTMTEAAVLTPEVSNALANANPVMTAADAVDDVVTGLGKHFDSTLSDAEALELGRAKAAEALVDMAKLSGADKSLGAVSFGSTIASNCKWLAN